MCPVEFDQKFNISKDQIAQSQIDPIYTTPGILGFTDPDRKSAQKAPEEQAQKMPEV